MSRIMISPSRYVQGKREIRNAGRYAKGFGNSAVLIALPGDYERVKADLEEGFKKENIELTFVAFNGESTYVEIDRITDLAKKANAQTVIGLGGGKALDTAKMVAFNCNARIIVVPTIAATDAPTSKTTVVYTAEGEFEAYVFQDRNPDIVLVDSAVIAKAPVRFLISGMGDALATVFEARATKAANALNVPLGKPTKTAQAVAEACYQSLLTNGKLALAAAKHGVVNEALENIIETNILMSGLGFESSGLAASHAVADGLTTLEEAHHYMHGEKVAFGVLTQLVLENTEASLLNEVFEFCYSVGLPMCLADLNCHDFKAENLKSVAELACSERETMGNMPFHVEEDDVIAAILTADYLGRAFKDEKNNK